MELKKQINFPQPSRTFVKLGEYEVSVDTFLSVETQRILAEVFMREFFQVEDSMRVFNAERALLVGILEYCTDLYLFEDITPKFSMNDIYANWEFVEKVRRAIRNYNEFRATLRMTVDETNREKELDEGLGRSLKVIVAQVTNFLEDVENTISPEKLNQIKELVQETNGSEILKAIAGKIK